MALNFIVEAKYFINNVDCVYFMKFIDRKSFLKLSVFSFFLLNISFYLKAQSSIVTLKECAEISEIVRGKDCNKANNSINVKLKNVCTENVDIKLCLQRGNGSWNCITNLDGKQNGITQHYSTDGTGEYRVWIEKTFDETKLPTEKEIK